MHSISFIALLDADSADLMAKRSQGSLVSLQVSFEE